MIVYLDCYRIMLVTWPVCNMYTKTSSTHCDGTAKQTRTVLNQTETQRQALESEACSVVRALDQGLGRKPESQEADPPKANNNNKNKQTQNKQTKTKQNNKNNKKRRRRRREEKEERKKKKQKTKQKQNPHNNIRCVVDYTRYAASSSQTLHHRSQ